ncbi:hypothetical protein LINPERPRIM_LOCUS17732 [Linum perenne]
MQQEGQQQVIFETDSQVLCSNLERPQSDSSEFGLIVRYCLALLTSFPQWRVQFVRRERNRVAHELARRSIAQGSTVTCDNPPPWLIDSVNAICVNFDHE